MTIRTGSDPLIRNCTFISNSADRGGAVFVREAAAPTFIGCNFETNTSTEDGGAIYCEGESRPTIQNCIFSGNQSTAGNGGAIAAYKAAPSITSCTFISNHASGGKGGALSLNESQGDTVRLSTFTLNTAEEGGAVYMYQAKNVQILQSRFEDNSGNYGGGVYLEGSGTETNPILFTNCILWKNQADYGGGAVLGTDSYNLDSFLKIEHCTVTGNIAEEGGVSAGGGAHISIGSKLTIVNSLLWNNTADEYQEIYSLFTVYVTVNYSNIKGGWVGAGNINAEPLFEDSINGDFHLQDGSPCKGAGEGGNEMGAYGGVYGIW